MSAAGQTKIGYLGPVGTFSEEAARRKFAVQPNVLFEPFATIPDVLEAAQNEEVSYGVVPIENSVEGSVNVTLDWLAHEGDLVIVGEEIVPITQNLVGFEGVSLDQITQVSSHPQALAQCRGYLRKLKGVKITSAESTAGAIERVASEGNRSWAAIGTSWAADRYGLKILASNIQDAQDNSTRFFVVTKMRNAEIRLEESIDYKTSLLITLAADHTGALVYILNVFSAVGINLTKIESRPTRKTLGSYWFLVDIEGHQYEEKVKRAIQAIGTFGHEVRILGSYQIHQNL